MYQEILIVGNLGRDPEMRYTPSGKAVTNISVAVNEKWGDNERTTWFRVSAWNGLAEVLNQYLSKGDLVLVKGSLRGDDNGGPRVWTGKDGEPRASFEIVARTVKFLRTKGRDGEEAPEEYEPETDELPF